MLLPLTAIAAAYDVVIVFPEESCVAFVALSADFTLLTGSPYLLPIYNVPSFATAISPYSIDEGGGRRVCDTLLSV